MSVTEALLAHSVDYAGLFPPAALGMRTVVENYHRSIEGDRAWMLGNLLVASDRLEEFRSAFEQVCCAEREQPWTVSVIASGQHEEDARRVREFAEGAVYLGSLEVKAADLAAVEAALRTLPRERALYVEFPPHRAEEILPVLAARGARAKLRMGGVRAEAIPTVDTVADFLLGCARERVAWKATAGLHHAMRGVRSLTDEPGSERATMHGFVNLLLAGALAWFGGERVAVVRTLEEEDPAAFQVYEDVIRWQGNALITDQVEQVREQFAMGFGSCSFDEPAGEIEGFGWR